MSGVPVTSGLPAKRGSSVASGTSNSESSRIAWAQNACSRGVSLTPGSPTFALNHWRSTAVATGFTGPDEGGFAPNMAVVDATGNEFILEVPCGPAKATGIDRDAIFKMAATKIQAWLAFHPTAIGAPPSVTPAQ